MPTDQIQLLKEENIDYTPLINKLYELAIKHQFLRVEVEILKRMSEQKSYRKISSIRFINLAWTREGKRFDGSPTKDQPSKEQLIKCLQDYDPEEDMRLDISLSSYGMYDAFLHFSPEDRKFIVEESESELLENYCEGDDESIDNFIKEMISISLKKRRVLPKQPLLKTLFKQTDSPSTPTDALPEKAKPGIPFALIDKIYEHAVKDDSVHIVIEMRHKNTEQGRYQKVKLMDYNAFTTAGTPIHCKVNPQPSKEALIEMMQHYNPEKDMILQIELSTGSSFEGCPYLTYSAERQGFDADGEYFKGKQDDAAINAFIEGMGAVIPSSAPEEEEKQIGYKPLIDKLYQFSVEHTFVRVEIDMLEKSRGGIDWTSQQLRYNLLTTGATIDDGCLDPNQPSKEALTELIQRYNPKKDMELRIEFRRRDSGYGYGYLSYYPEVHRFAFTTIDEFDFTGDQKAAIDAFIEEMKFICLRKRRLLPKQPLVKTHFNQAEKESPPEHTPPPRLLLHRG